MAPTPEQLEHIERWARDSFPDRTVSSSLIELRDVALIRASRTGHLPLELEVSYEAFEDVAPQRIVEDLARGNVAERLLRAPEVRLIYTRNRQVLPATNRQPPAGA